MGVHSTIFSFDACLRLERGGGYRENTAGRRKDSAEAHGGNKHGDF